MCRYSEAAQACDIAGRRAEYTARESSRIAGRIDDSRSQTHREAEALVDEWVAVKDGLATAADILTLIAQHPAAFEAFCAGLSRPGLPPVRAPISGPARAAAPAQAVTVLRAARGF